MEHNVIYNHSLQEEMPLPNRKEILRYMGYKGEATDEINNMIDHVLPFVIEKAVPKSAFVIKKINIQPDSVCIDETRLKSYALRKNLDGCEDAIMFASTIGSDVDRLITAQFAISTANAVVADAIATVTIELYCDILCKELGQSFEKEGLFLRPRFSPGYGDFSIENQNYFIRQTDASKRCAIYLSQALILTPHKTVTGIIGLSKTAIGCHPSGCEMCEKKNCKFRR